MAYQEVVFLEDLQSLPPTLVDHTWWRMLDWIRHYAYVAEADCAQAEGEYLDVVEIESHCEQSNARISLCKARENPCNVELATRAISVHMKRLDLESVKL